MRSRIGAGLLCSLFLALSCLDAGSGQEYSTYCKKLCLHGRGGNLCKCNAVHFVGKRSQIVVSPIGSAGPEVGRQHGHVIPTRHGARVGWSTPPGSQRERLHRKAGLDDMEGMSGEERNRAKEKGKASGDLRHSRNARTFLNAFTRKLQTFVVDRNKMDRPK